MGGGLTPAEWFEEVWRLDGGRCCVTGRKVRRTERNTRHHPLPKAVLKRHGLADRLWDPRNGMLVEPRVHERHETAFERIPYARVPQRCKDFAAELGPWAEVALERRHP